MNASLLLPLFAVLFLASSSSAASNSASRQTAAALGDQRERDLGGEGMSYDDPMKALKEKYRDQKRAIEGAPQSQGLGAGIMAPALAASSTQAPPPQGREMSIAELEALLLKVQYCEKNPRDTAELAPDLKGKVGLVTCRKDPANPEAFVLVPKSVRPEQQLMYAGQAGLKFLGARFVDHYLVLQFDKQIHYLDLRKPTPNGFSPAGYAVGGDLDQFSDFGAFSHALKTFSGVKADSKLLTQLPALISKVAGSESYRLGAREHQGEWYVVVATKIGATRVWPEMKTP